MRLIHCADIHLDAVMESTLPAEQAAKRRQEVLYTFLKLFDYAAEQEVSVILVAGDLFDTDYISASTAAAVISAAERHPNIDLLYLAGNHDRSSKKLFRQYDLPQNIKNFSESWQSFRYDDVVISGIELSEENSINCYEKLSLDAKDVNIVALHGQSGSQRGLDLLDIKSLAAYPIDYLALGHIHAGQEIPFKDGSTAAYSGSLEGRGFDEPGEKGFVLVEIENQKITRRFVPFAMRQVWISQVDISGIGDLVGLQQTIETAVKDIPQKDVVRVELVGSFLPELPKDLSYLRESLRQRFFWGEIKDRSKLSIDYKEYEKDISLKGEFVRMVLQGNYSEEERELILLSGLRALNGEEPMK